MADRPWNGCAQTLAPRKRGPKRRSSKPPRNPELMDWRKIERLRAAIDGREFNFDIDGFVDSMVRDAPNRNNG